MESVITHLKDREIDPELELEIRDTRELLYQQMESASNFRKDGSNYMMSDISNIDDINHHTRASSDIDRVRNRDSVRDRERNSDKEVHRRELGSTFDLFSPAEAISPIRRERSLDLPHMDPGPRPGLLPPKRTTGILDTAGRFHSREQTFSASSGATQYPDSVLSHTSQNHRIGQPMNEHSETRISRTANSSLTFSPFQKTLTGQTGAYDNTQTHIASTRNGHAHLHQNGKDGLTPPVPVPRTENRFQDQSFIPPLYTIHAHDHNAPFAHKGPFLGPFGPFQAPPQPPLTQGLSLDSNYSVPIQPVINSVGITGPEYDTGSGSGSGSFSDHLGLKKDPTYSNGVSRGLGGWTGTGGAGSLHSTPSRAKDRIAMAPPRALSEGGTFSSLQNIPGSVFSVRTPYDARILYSSSDSTYTTQPVHLLTNSPGSSQGLTAGAPTDRYSSSRMTDFGRNLQLLSQKLDALDSYGKIGGSL